MSDSDFPGLYGLHPGLRDTRIISGTILRNPGRLATMDVTSMEELSLCFRWLKDGKPEEHFLQVIPEQMQKLSLQLLLLTWEKRELMSNICEG